MEEKNDGKREGELVGDGEQSQVFVEGWRQADG